MGATHVMVTIRNPADPERQWTGRFLVDTGAFDSLVPRPHLEAIGLKPLASENYVLADGSPIELSTTVGRIEFMGKIVGGTLVFGDADAEPLLGVTALESGGFEVDPRSQRLKKLPAVLLKVCASPAPAGPRSGVCAAERRRLLEDWLGARPSRRRRLAGYASRRHT